MASATLGPGITVGPGIKMTAGTAYVASGLEVYYDIANPTSYSGSGATITDLSGKNNTGTILFGKSAPSVLPTYSSSNGGYLTFNSTGNTQFISISNTTSYSTYTLSFWVYMLSYSPSGNINTFFETGNDNSTFYQQTQSNGNHLLASWNGSSSAFGNPITTNTWYNLVVTVNPSGLTRYVNGSVDVNLAGYVANIQPGPASGTDFTGHYILMAGFPMTYTPGNYETRVINGNFAQFMLYNRALTSAEVLTNFNSFRGRYGV